MKKSTIILALLVFSFLKVDAQLTLPAIFQDGMVFQRGTDIKVWGKAGADEKVKVSFNGKSAKAKADNSGCWEVVLPPQKAGGPFILKVLASEEIIIHDVLVGDVWLCSGQSNMVHYMGIHNERYAKEIEEADFPEIRQFLIPTTGNLQGPADDLKGTWDEAVRENIDHFSVVAYFFGLNLYKEYSVPIGLINASVGGTPIEAWTSEDGFSAYPEILTKIERNKDTAYVNEKNRKAHQSQQLQNSKRGKDAGMSSSPRWYEEEYVPKNWHNFTVPGYWEDQGIRNLDGVVWFRREIDVPETMIGIPAKIAMGRIVDADEVYVNGKRVGGKTYQYPQRRYEFEAGLLKEGKNIIVIRVTNSFGKGGFVPDKPYYLQAGDERIDLKGDWQYKVGEVYTHDSWPVSGISAIHQPSALFNGMIAPFVGYSLKGFVWYQGESNAGNPSAYLDLQKNQIRDWRKQWGSDDLPFLYVQLPNYMEVDYLPAKSNWALLREAQFKALSEPKTGMAVTIDLGEWNDIHPDRKKPVGDRLALLARKMVYGEKDLVSSGPMYQSHRIEDSKIIVTFNHVGSGLVSGNGEELAHFAIAGADEKYVWANAEIEGNTVVVWNDEISEPVYLKYAWADNPDFANLYNKEGLPASPFRIIN